MMELLAAALDPPFVRQFAQHVLERGAVGILEAEGTRDLAGADFSRLLADESDEIVLRRNCSFGHVSSRNNQWSAIRSPLCSVQFPVP
jgi:hypothetical protein